MIPLTLKRQKPTTKFTSAKFRKCFIQANHTERLKTKGANRVPLDEMAYFGLPNFYSTPYANTTWPEVIKRFMLNLAEHEILNAYKDKISRNSAFLGSDKPVTLLFMPINVEMPTS